MGMPLDGGLVNIASRDIANHLLGLCLSHAIDREESPLPLLTYARGLKSKKYTGSPMQN